MKPRKLKGNVTWVDGDIAYVELASPKYGRYVAKVDAKRLDEVKTRTWSIRTTSYTNIPTYGQSGSPTNILMHIFLFPDCPDGLVRDHINGDGFDNREENIRFVPQWLNAKNANNRNRRRMPGVRYDFPSGRFYAWVGPYETEEEAHEAWKDWVSSLGYLI